MGCGPSFREGAVIDTSDIIDIGLGSDYPMPYDKGTRTRPQQRRILIRLY